MFVHLPDLLQHQRGGVLFLGVPHPCHPRILIVRPREREHQELQMVTRWHSPAAVSGFNLSTAVAHRVEVGLLRHDRSHRRIQRHLVSHSTLCLRSY